MSKQIIHSQKYLISTTTLYDTITQNSLNGEQAWVWNDAQKATTPWSVAGTFSNLKVTLKTAPGGATSRTFTLHKNGSNTGLTVTISGASLTATDSTNSVSVSPGDELGLQHTQSGTPADATVSILLEFDSTNPGESGYVHANLHGVTATAYAPCFLVIFPTDYSEFPFTDPKGAVSVAGALTRYDIINYDNNGAGEEPLAGGGETLVINVVKNGIVQDGTGGTVNTTRTLTDAVSRVNWTGTLTFDVGDTVHLQYVGSGNLTGTQLIGNSACYLADTPGEFMLSSGFVWDPGTTRYSIATSPNLVSATESEVEGIGGPTTFYITGLVLTANNTLGGENITGDIRFNGATPAGTPFDSFIGADAGAAGSGITLRLTTIPPGGGSYITVTNTDTWAMRVRPGTPITGSAVFGVNTTVKASRAVAFGLDGNTNVHDTEGMCKIFGDLEVTGNLSGAISGDDVNDDLDGLGE